jgi:hypothetical protein
VEVLQEMVQTLRGLSNEMGEKLQQATGDSTVAKIWGGVLWGF